MEDILNTDYCYVCGVTTPLFECDVGGLHTAWFVRTICDSAHCKAVYEADLRAFFDKRHRTSRR